MDEDETKPTTAHTILVVEDEILVRMDICETLRTHGYTVLEAPNADDALKMLDSGVLVHLVFTDIRMPGKFDGLDLARYARGRDLPVLLTSGNVYPKEVPLEMRPLMLKPYSHSDILNELRLKLSRNA